MNIRDLINERTIVLDVKPNEKDKVLEELAGVIASENKGIDFNLLVEKLVERESLSSTGIGDGIAIPHCKYEGINGILMAFGRSIDGIDFDSIDHRPVNILFLLVAPNTQQAAGDHLRAMAKITRILKSDDFKKKLMLSETCEDIYKLISEEDEKY